MEITGIALYNKNPFQPHYTTYTKPDPITFDDLLKGQINRNLNPSFGEQKIEAIRKDPLDTLAELNAEKARVASLVEQIAMYKEDQLLSNPGGDSVYVNANGELVNKGNGHSSFTVRVGKDLNDAKGNFVNMFKDAAHGSEFHYVTKNGEVSEGQRVGVVKTFENFFKDLFSGFTLGAYTPGDEEEPSGVADSVKHSLKKVFVDALYNDVLVGIPRGVGHVAKDAALVTLNLAETIPDATIGNMSAGEVVTNKVFDDTQVALEFLTDALPGGEGRGRVYAFKLGNGVKGLPFIHNLTKKDEDNDEEETKYVRNTPFRKTIETISSIMPIGAAM